MEESKLVERIVKAIVDYPEDVKVNVSEGSRSTIIELKSLI